MEYELTTFPSGLRLIAHHMPSTRSVAIGCWVDTGSRDETGPEAGASHFLEHLLFKGSETWSARDISEAFDSVGARHNAFTSKEYTCFGPACEMRISRSVLRSSRRCFSVQHSARRKSTANVMSFSKRST